MKSQIGPLLLDHLRRLAQGIVELVGPQCEVVIHDFSDPEHSVIFITGDLTGRKPGAPVPDLSFIRDKLDRNTPDQLNYKTTIGDMTFQSTTIWLRDEHGEITGAVCINLDYSSLIQAQELIESFLLSSRRQSGLVVEDTFAQNLDHLIELTVHNFMKSNHIQDINQLTSEEKIQIARILDKKGLFEIRGAANKLADLLGVSRASIYNYRAIKEEERILSK